MRKRPSRRGDQLCHGIAGFQKEVLRQRLESVGYWTQLGGKGMKKIADAVTDCHLEEIAELLSQLAVKLGIVPEVGWLEELLHILIEGVHIEEEVGDACVDYGNGNWAGFGYNIAKLVKTLL